MNAEQKYRDFQALAAKVEKETKLYLADENVDAENVDASVERGSDEWWVEMLRHGQAAFGMRCESAGLDANDFGVRY